MSQGKNKIEKLQEDYERQKKEMWGVSDMNEKEGWHSPTLENQIGHSELPEISGCWHYPTLEDQIGHSDLPEISNAKEMINHPDHYQSSKFEVIEVIEAFDLGFSLGNSVKYILRAGKKDKDKTIEDLKKAIWYIERQIKSLGEK